MKFQSPGSGLRLFYVLAKLYGGDTNWYRGKNWAFRTRWRLFSYGKAFHSFGRNRFNACSKKPIIEGGIVDRWFSWKFIDFNLVQFENSDRLRGCFVCIVLIFFSYL